jgi:hypothetical protein
MANKDWNKLNIADQQIRQLSPNKGITAGTKPQVRITLIRGFELFNTRPYHNYETWSDGYKLELFNDNGDSFYSITAEDLDDLLAQARRENKV